ncbi:MAG: hypothetical protein LC721_08675, partial [Actinobacteria bacterium]|nr:hypothetical protein [Actinomycetota bacterium]
MRARQVPRARVARSRYVWHATVLANRVDHRSGLRRDGVVVLAIAALAVVLGLTACATTSSPAR